MQGSHRNDVLPLTPSLNCCSACDNCSVDLSTCVLLFTSSLCACLLPGWKQWVMQWVYHSTAAVSRHHWSAYSCIMIGVGRYLTVKITEGQTHHITCPGFNCAMLVPVDIIEKLVSRDMARRYLQFDIKVNVDWW